MSQIKKYKFNLSNGKYTFYTTIEGSGRFDVESRMKMLYKDCKSINFMGEVRQMCYFTSSYLDLESIN